MTYGASLDWLNFLLADVRGGLGPYVSVFLLTQAHWDQATIGAVLTVSGIVGITLHTPVGALIDTTHRNGRSSLPAWLPCPYVRCRSRGPQQCRSCWQQTLRWLCSARFSRRLLPRSR